MFKSDDAFRENTPAFYDLNLRFVVYTPDMLVTLRNSYKTFAGTINTH